MKKLISSAVLAILSGCAITTHPKVEAPSIDRPAAVPVDMGVDWDWRVVGDAAVRPVQVFGSNGQTYVQMRDRRPVVLMVNGVAVPYLTSWPYLVVQGAPDQIDVVAEGYRAIAEHQTSVQEIQKPLVGAEPAQPAQAVNRIERIKIK